MGTIAFFQNLQTGEILIIVVVALLIFGAKLPEMARKLGKGVQEFRRGLNEASSEVKRELEAAADAAEGQKGCSPPVATVSAPMGEVPEEAPAPEEEDGSEGLKTGEGETVLASTAGQGPEGSPPAPKPTPPAVVTNAIPPEPSPKPGEGHGKVEGQGPSPVADQDRASMN